MNSLREAMSDLFGVDEVEVFDNIPALASPEDDLRREQEKAEQERPRRCLTFCPKIRALETEQWHQKRLNGLESREVIDIEVQIDELIDTCPISGPTVDCGKYVCAMELTKE